jgi:hypothetical protein
MKGLDRNSVHTEEEVLLMMCKWAEIAESCNTYSTLGMATTDCQLTAAFKYYRKVMNIDTLYCVGCEQHRLGAIKLRCETVKCFVTEVK